MAPPLAPDFRPQYHELHRVGRPGIWRSLVGAVLLLLLVFALVPLVAGTRASIVDVDGQLVRLVGYPLRPRDQADAPTLEALIGVPRARILRELDEPASNNRLASVLQTVPSAATHHVSALSAAGLVVRDRSNGSLRVRRTARGDALVALYDAP